MLRSRSSRNVGRRRPSAGARARSSRAASTGSCGRRVARCGSDSSVLRAEQPRLLGLEPDQAARRRGRGWPSVSARRVDLPSRTTAPAAGVRPAAAPGCGSTGRRGRPGRGRGGTSESSAPADEQDEQQRRDEQAEHRVEEPEEVELAACSGVAAASTFCIADQQRAVEVAPLEQRQHVVLEDRLALRVGQERRAEPGPGVQLDLAVARVVLVEVEQDHEAVVEARAGRRPTGPSAPGRCCSASLGRLAARDELGVDDDLGAGARPRSRRSSPRPVAIGRRRGARRPCRRRPGRRPGAGTAGPAASGEADGDEARAATAERRRDARRAARRRRAHGAHDTRARGVRRRRRGAVGAGGGRGSGGRARPPARSARSWASGRCPATSSSTAASSASAMSMPASVPAAPAARIRARVASGIVMPGTSLWRNSAWRAETSGSTPEQQRDREPARPEAAPRLGEHRLDLRHVVQRLGHDQVRARRRACARGGPTRSRRRRRSGPARRRS